MSGAFAVVQKLHSFLQQKILPSLIVCGLNETNNIKAADREGLERVEAHSY